MSVKRKVTTPGDACMGIRLPSHDDLDRAETRRISAPARLREVARSCAPLRSNRPVGMMSAIMPLRIVRLGSPRHPQEGLRLGTVRRPPRGVPKTDFAARDFYDVWLPNLAPSEELLKKGKSVDDARSWASFRRGYLAEMKAPDASRLLDLVAALSHRTSLSVGCYCADESRCHRSLLRELLQDRGADIT
jgi:uncharacterized protein YeaO (DUF488 family)